MVACSQLQSRDSSKASHAFSIAVANRKVMLDLKEAINLVSGTNFEMQFQDGLKFEDR